VKPGLSLSFPPHLFPFFRPGSTHSRARFISPAPNRSQPGGSSPLTIKVRRHFLRGRKVRPARLSAPLPPSHQRLDPGPAGEARCPWLSDDEALRFVPLPLRRPPIPVCRRSVVTSLYWMDERHMLLLLRPSCGARLVLSFLVAPGYTDSSITRRRRLLA